MGIAIIPKDKKAMKKFVGKTTEWIDGFRDGIKTMLKEMKFRQLLDGEYYVLSIEQFDYLNKLFRNTKQS